MTDLIHPVLLCGGSGTRLWPLSRKSYPKQFVKLLGEESLFQSSARRLLGKGFAPPLVVTGSDFRFIVVEQLAAVEIAPQQILIEPSARNTAAAICAAAVALDAKKGDILMLVAPSDHVIPDAEDFRETVEAAVPAALAGQIVTFGIRPDRAETGYGWLELTTRPMEGSRPAPQPLGSFVEKPNAETAAALLKGGMHLWNAGIFLFSTSSILEAFAEHAPETLAGVRNAYAAAETDLGFTRLAAEPWSELEEISIDYAIMERARKLSVVPYRGSWSDLGDWQAMWRECEADHNGVVKRGPSTAFDCKNTLLYATTETQELVAMGLENIVAVAMPDAVLVAHKDRAQEITNAVAKLKAKGAAQAEKLARDYRPWGWYESIALGPRFQVKRIVVYPGAALSLQSHNHRSEHWVVVEGTAKVTIDDDVKTVAENQSVYIPLGTMHRMENSGKLPLTLIEVQTGSYFGEDDIIRYEDIYSRGQGAKG
ncbi:mannose-1-phosphate guanylyltransferase/mannose-6-phosphate isomerase [Alphaproteobacteria bacterium]|nr:mannose-1-phosphate guanylyltransferase/mannose-6-phosphate isomerase [Alphaproteobacteria bacterium]